MSSSTANAHLVIGVLPAGEFDRRFADAWMPLAFPPDAVRNFHYLNAIARLKPGVSLEQAQAEMSQIAGGIALQYPAIKKDWGATVDRWVDRLVGPQLRSVAAGVDVRGRRRAADRMRQPGEPPAGPRRAAVARGDDQRRARRDPLASCPATAHREPRAVGARRSGRSGARRCSCSAAFCRSFLPFFLPAQAQVGVDLRVTLFLGALTLLTGIAFGIFPALQASRRDPVEALKEGGRGAAGSRRRAFLRNALVTSQVALAFVLLCGAGLLIRSFDRLTNVDAGFDATNVVTMSFQMVMGRDVDGARLTGYVNQAIETVRAVPGVEDAAMTSALPLQGWGFGMPFRIDGRPFDPSRRPPCFFKIVTPGYFGTLNMTLRKGRRLTERDARGGLPVTVVNETFARQQFPDQDPIGQRVVIEQIVPGKRELGPEIPWEVVGVVADEKGERARQHQRGRLRQLRAEPDRRHQPARARGSGSRARSPSRSSRRSGGSTRTRRCPTCARSSRSRRTPSGRRGCARCCSRCLPAWRCCWRRLASTACCRTSRRSGRRSSDCAWRSAHPAGI